MSRPIRFAYTPDPDDAFHFCALQTGQLALPAGFMPTFTHDHIKNLNESCRRGDFDVCAISSIYYPQIEDSYVIMGSGTSVGRGYGPVLACHATDSRDTLAGCRVAVPGATTTGAFLLNYFYTDFESVSMPFDQVADAIIARDVAAGVLIHEELLNYRQQPLRKICCLGQRWFEHSGLPLPVGLLVAKRALGAVRLQQIARLLYDSMAWALDHRVQAMHFASTFGRGPMSAIREDFVAKFANEDTLSMPADVRLGLGALYAKAHKHGFISHQPALDLIDAYPPPSAGAVA